MRTMFNVLLILVFSLIGMVHTPVCAQNGTKDIPLQTKNKLVKAYGFGADGMVFESAKTFSKSVSNNTLHYVSADLSRSWEAALDLPRGMDFAAEVVMSPKAKWTYYLLGVPMNRTQTVFQADGSGLIRSKETGSWNDVGMVQSAFCDSKRLYFTTFMISQRESYEFGPMAHGMLKEDPGLALLSLDHESMSFQRTKINLPVSKDEMVSSWWEYAGHRDNEIWLMRRNVDPVSGLLAIELIAVDGEGKQLRSFDINPQPEGTQIVPGYHGVVNESSYFRTDNRFKKVVNEQNMTTRNGAAKAAAYGGLLHSSEENAFYIYGFLGTPNGKKSGYNHSGFFVRKVDSEGKTIWLNSYDFPASIQGKDYTMTGIYEYHNLELYNDSQKAVSMKLGYKDVVNLLQIDKESGVVGRQEKIELKGVVLHKNIDRMYMDASIDKHLKEEARKSKLELEWKAPHYYFTCPTYSAVLDGRAKGKVTIRTFAKETTDK